MKVILEISRGWGLGGFLIKIDFIFSYNEILFILIIKSHA